MSTSTKKTTVAINFELSEDIQLNPTSIYDEQSVADRLTSSKIFTNLKIESTPKTPKLIKSDKFPDDLALNGFTEAIHLAYSQHHNLALSPEHIFIVILQGLSIHISQEPEKYRSIVGLGHTEPNSKEAINICRDGFTLGNNDNDWQGVFPEFSEKIGNKVSKEIHTLLEKPFSTSTELSKAVTSLTIMDIFKSYFDYSVTTVCGIPNIALLGKSEDWKDLRNRTEALLTKFDDLKFWTEQLYPVLDQFVAVTNDKEKPIDLKFWNSLYKPHGGSGGPYICGWIGLFFPYVQSYEGSKVNRFINWSETEGPFSGLTYDLFPSGFTTTPFVWSFFGESIKMKFLGGFLGVERVDEKESDIDGYVIPGLSWAVVHED